MSHASSATTRRRQRLTRSSLLFTSLTALLACTQQEGEITVRAQNLSNAEVYLSEIHYDNAGTDIGEAVEVTGIAGTDLSGYSLVLYSGSSGTVYGTFPLSGVLVEEADGLGTNVVSMPSNRLQNGAPDGIALVHGENVLEFLSYEGSFVARNGPADGILSVDIGVSESSSSPHTESLQRAQRGGVSSWIGPLASSFGQINKPPHAGDNDNDNETDIEPMLGICGDTFTAIAAIQGRGSTSPLARQTVEIEGVVVGDFQGSDQLGGYFVQSEIPDADLATSEGVFVFEGATTAINVSVGRKVRIAGTVSEYFGLTEIIATNELDCGIAPLPEPRILPFPVTSPEQLESLEGMRVSASHLIASETYDLGRHGEVMLSTERLFHRTNRSMMSAVDSASHRILLDDGRDGQYLVPVPYLAPDGILRLGDRLAHLDAVLTFSFGAFRLQPVKREDVTFLRENPRPKSPTDVGGDVSIASLNVLNYFTTLDERGANSAAELERQRTKLVSTIVALDADVLGLTEIENNERASGRPLALESLVFAVNESLGRPTYARAPDPTFTGNDAIRTALIYKPAVVEALGSALSDDNSIHSRPPIAQIFSYQDQRFSVVINHFKSKGSCPDRISDPDSDFGQGCWNEQRVKQAEALLQFISQIKQASRSDDVVVLGDFNSYFAEDPIRTLQAGGLTNLIANVPEDQRYSYVFNGEAGVLDYAFSTPSLHVTGTTIWHINADEPRMLDYNIETNPAQAYQPDPYRSSDHDPVLIGISWPQNPQFLLTALSDAAEACAQQTQLMPRAQQVKWRVLLRGVGSDIALGLKIQDRRPHIARRHFASASLKLRLFEERVEYFARRRLLSRVQAEDLLERSQNLRDML